VICKAVAHSILSVHLPKFQQHIETVERNVLLKDASSVGAYNIVPLASIIQEFTEWKRILEWYWEIACFVAPTNNSTVTSESRLGNVCTGPSLLDKLRADMNTGYQDIEDAATQLLVVGEQALMRIVSCWLLTGRLPDVGRADFFVQQNTHTSNQTISHVLERQLIPTSVSVETASSVLFIGKTVRMLGETGSGSTIHIARQSRSVATSLMPTTMSNLRTINYPLKSALLSAVITTIRRDLSRALGNSVLPMHAVLDVLTHIRNFFLAGRSDFTDYLIDEADKYLDQRHQQTRATSRSVANTDLVGITMKATEVRTVMNRTWVAVSSSSAKETLQEYETEWAHEHLTLKLSQSADLDAGLEEIIASEDNNATLAVGAKFDDFLLATPVELKLNLDSSYNLFLLHQDRRLYSTIQTYLIAIRRAHNHVSRLWKDGALRKTVNGNKKRKSNATLVHQRATDMRKIWTTCSTTVAALSEIGSFFSTEVIDQSWSTFRQWAAPQKAHRKLDTSEGGASSSIQDEATTFPNLPHDLETLAIAHRHYLETLAQSLLLTDEPWTRTMRSLLTHVDNMVAFVTRHQLAQANVELYSGNVDGYLRSKYVREEDHLFEEAKKSCVRVEEAVSKLTDRLKHINFNELKRTALDTAQSSFEPWQPGNGGIERLLLRLDMRCKEGPD